MELSDEKVLESLLALWERDQLGKKGRRKSSQLAAEKSSYSPPLAKSSRRRCQCGVCHQCQEDARWERIFAEKFADREYYKRDFVRVLSPLSEL